MQLNWTAPARTDLRAIEAWLAKEASPELAVRFLVAIRLRADFLLDFPRGGRPVLHRDFRVLRVHNTPYLILYRVRDTMIDILRVSHEREDWQVPV